MTRRTDAELKQLAIDIEEGRVFTHRHVRRGDESLLGMIFMPLTFMKDLPKNLKTYLLYEYMNKALPTGVNGYPIFLSFQMIARRDTNRLEKHIAAFRAAKEKFRTG